MHARTTTESEHDTQPGRMAGSLVAGRDPTMNAGLRPRTHVVDAILANVSDGLDYDEIDAVVDCACSATVTACQSGHFLVDWDEYLWSGAL